jgi:hypothetical protein
VISVPVLRKSADLIFVMNEPIKDFLIARGVDEKRLVITNCGVDETVHEVESGTFLMHTLLVASSRIKEVLDLVPI